MSSSTLSGNISYKIDPNSPIASCKRKFNGIFYF